MPEKSGKFVDSGDLRLALREVRTQIMRPGYVVSVGAAAVLLAFVGAFGTEQVLRFVPRLIYWLVVAFVTSAIGMICAEILVPLLRRRAWQFGVIIATVGVLTAVPIVFAVALIGLITFGPQPLDEVVKTLVPQVFGVTLIICGASAIVFRDQFSGQPAPGSPPALLERLPFDKRGALLALSVGDHYTEVVTDKGVELLLMRLADAIRETAPVAGLQVHRSHWVALAAIRSVRREGDRAVITLTNDREVPVSRGSMPALKDAGLLPR